MNSVITVATIEYVPVVQYLYEYSKLKFPTHYVKNTSHDSLD